MIIGVMGGVGSGKSTVLNYLENNYEANIIEADKVAKEVMLPGNDVYNEIVKTFPEVIADNKIDSKKLAEIVFNNKEQLEKLNSITHPGAVKEIVSRIKSSKNRIIVVESAILLGSGVEQYCDELWFVFCNRDTRIKRLIQTRGYSKEKCISVIESQPADEEYNKVADEFIDNSYSEENTREQIDLILNTSACI
ncbi:MULTISPECIES: dephospho-CoA kinase [unclassified Eubacterium (in: firmicutes)]|jgi:dephospho-CoA kinase|uniref:dephospho-CoA kinase n=1 Tax=Eubacterium TaxID=1730 RepID=UPI000E4A2674|nr:MULTISPECIES: dephospho-CoA kinase [unclassified Eubacterium (in: firmicutes)]RGF51106.1 dephospho-CoA kinase [Eubacterium sp. AF36-5BH]RHP21838.1 dephospho-CoA kinase [Eubacterium sp. AF34-35BH]